jgi:heptosyltransferase-1
VVDTQGLLKSALVCKLAKGTRHGMDGASAREPVAARFYDVTHSVAKGLHAVERNRILTAASLGYALDAALEAPVDYGLRAPGALPGVPAAAPAPYAVFLTMTSRDDKLWPQESWIELGRALRMRVVLPWGSAPEKARAEAIAAGIGEAAVWPRSGLAQLATLLSRAGCVVGLDTGLTHLAAALGPRSVGIYCGSDPLLTGLHGSASAANVGRPGHPPSVAEVLEALV